MPERFKNAKVLRRELEAKKISPRYLFLGEEEGEKDKFIARVIEMSVEPGSEMSGSVGRFHLNDSDELLRAADFALSQSMFSSSRVCVIRDLDRLSSTASNRSMISEMVLSSPPGTTLIMVSPENRPPSVIDKDTLKEFNTVVFWRYFDQDIYNYIQINLRNLGLSIDDRALKRLLEKTGKDIKKIDEAIDIIRYSGESSVITEELVDDFIHDTRESTVFEFIDSLFMRKKGSLLLLKKLIDEGTPDLLILNLVLKRAEALEKYHSLASEGTSESGALSGAGITKRNEQSFRAQAAAYGKGPLKEVFPAIAHADATIKSGRRAGGLADHPLLVMASSVLFGA